MDGRQHESQSQTHEPVASPPSLPSSSTASHPADSEKQPTVKFEAIGQASSSAAAESPREDSSHDGHPLQPDADSENDATVITRDAPFAPRPNFSYMHPRDLGRTLEGKRLDHFELEEFIGGGGMGAVFRAHDTLLDRTVAVKVLASGQSENKETRLRFRNEAQSAARLDHPNIARAYYVGEDQGVHYIVFEYIEGVNVRDLVQTRGVLSVEETLSITLQIAEALAHAGHRDVVHRDIKPSNILIMPEGQAKLVDMGLARMQHLGDRTDDLTATGVTLGTFDYISPEQARDPRYADTRSDIYSLGCTLFFMLCGSPPFPDGTVLQKLLQHQEDHPPDPRDYRNDILPEVADIVITMLAKSPEDRYQSPVELIAAIVSVAEQCGLSLAHPGAAVPLLLNVQSDSAIRRHLPWLVPAAILIASVFFLDRMGRRSAHTSVNSMRVEPPSARVDSWSNKPLQPSQDESATPDGSPPEPTAVSMNDSTASGSGASSREIASDPAQTASLKRSSLNNLNDSKVPVGLMNDSITVFQTDILAHVAAPSPLAGIAMPAEWIVRRELLAYLRTTNSIASDTRSNAATKVVSHDDAPLVVSPNDGDFSTVRDACHAAKSGQIIELRYDGPLQSHGDIDVWEQPITLTNKHLTIRAADGFRPLLRFRQMVSTSDQMRGVVVVTESSLRLVHLDILVDVTPSTEPCSLVHAIHAESITIRDCRITMRGGSPPDSTNQMDTTSDAFFDLSLVSNNSTRETSSIPNNGDAIRIRLDNCILRGDAVLVRAPSAAPFDLAWTNGLFATSHRLVERFSRGASGSSPTNTRQVRVELNHVTAVFGQGIVQLPPETGVAPFNPVSIACQDCLIVGDASTVLVDHPSAHQLAAEQTSFFWRGERTYYHGVETFLRLGNVDGVSLQLGYDGWQEYWAKQPHGDEIHTARIKVHWKRRPAIPGPMQNCLARDYELDDTEADYPELHAASDGGPIGLRCNLLPNFEAAPPADSGTTTTPNT